MKQCLFCEKEGRATKIYQGFEAFSFFSLQLVSLVSPPCSLGSSMFAYLSPLWDTFRYKKCSFSFCDGNFGLFTLAEIFLWTGFVSFGWPLRLTQVNWDFHNLPYAHSLVCTHLHAFCVKNISEIVRSWHSCARYGSSVHSRALFKTHLTCSMFLMSCGHISNYFKIVHKPLF